MPKKYIHNDTDKVMFAGGLMIQPGDGREVDVLPGAEDFEPLDDDQDERPTLDPDEALRDMLKDSVKNLTTLLPDASDETLASLARLEGEADSPRTTLLSAIAEEQLKRAQLAAGGPPT